MGKSEFLARSDHHSEVRKFSYQPIRKLETIQMFMLFSLSVLFTSPTSLELSCLCKKIPSEQPNSHSSQLDEEDLNKLKEAVTENNACSSSMQSREVNCLFVSDEQNSLIHSGSYAKLPIHKLYD